MKNKANIKQGIINRVVKNLFIGEFFMNGEKIYWRECDKETGDKIYRMEYYAGMSHGWGTLIVLDPTPTKNNNEYDLYISMNLRVPAESIFKEHFLFEIYSLHTDEPGAVSEPFRRALINFMENKWDITINDVFDWETHSLLINERGHVKII